MRPSTKRLATRMVAAGTLFLAWIAAPMTAIASAGEGSTEASDAALAWFIALMILLGAVLDDGAPF
jgi:hypothetical protein